MPDNETTTDIATAQDNAPIEGLEDFGPEELIIPRLKLVQPSSADGTPGTFRDNLSGAEYDSARIVPLAITKGRVMWVEGEELPVCRSKDALVPDPMIEEPQNDICARRSRGRLVDVCEQSKWEGGPPPCKLTYTLLGLNLDADESPFLITLSGTGIKPTRKLISTYSLKRVSLYAMSVVMSAAKARGAQGNYYVVSFADYQPLADGQQYRPQFIELRGYTEPEAEGSPPASSTGSDSEQGAGETDPEDLPF